MEALSQPDTAAAHFRAYLELRPEDNEVRNCFGILLAKQRRHGEAMACFHEILHRDAKQAKAHNNLGAAYSDLGRYAEALGHFQQAIELWPD
jgi:tetratricopeptide (TPR) repeat protein